MLEKKKQQKLLKGRNVMKKNKYVYLFVLQGFYSYGWEDLTASESWKEVKQDKKDYIKNERGIYRVVKRRELSI
jgi:hypothetical protein